MHVILNTQSQLAVSACKLQVELAMLVQHGFQVSSENTTACSLLAGKLEEKFKLHELLMEDGTPLHNKAGAWEHAVYCIWDTC